MYAIHTVIVLYGLFLFLWWWRKTGSATEVYILVTIIFAAETIEKGFFTWLRYMSQYGGVNGHNIHINIVQHSYWWLTGLPTTLAYFAFIVVISRRLYKSYRILSRKPTIINPFSRKTERKVLVFSTTHRTRQFMNEVFAMNNVEFYNSSDFIDGMNVLVSDPDISVIFLGLNIIHGSGIKTQEVLRLIKAERPWAIVIAMTTHPSLYELYETRRSSFDDYLYLPIPAQTLMGIFDSTVSKIDRWKSMKFAERRKKDGEVVDRHGLKTREQRKKDEGVRE